MKFQNGARLATTSRTASATEDNNDEDMPNSYYDSQGYIPMPRRSLNTDETSSRLSTPELIRHAITVMTIKVRESLRERP